MEDINKHKTQESDPQPPQAPPDVGRKFRLEKTQTVVLPLFFLVPILALFGVFGRSSGTVQARGARLELRVDYPTKAHNRTEDSIVITVRNVSRQDIPKATLAISRSYLEAFSKVTVTPDVKDVTAAEYDVELTAIPAGDERQVIVELQGEDAGAHRGVVTARLDEAPQEQPEASVDLRTLILP